MDNKRQLGSLTVMTELVLPNDANILGNLLGGRLLHWIDIAGAMAASRFTQGLVATVRMDPVVFRHPVKVGSIVTLTAWVTWTGHTSLEVKVDVAAEDWRPEKGSETDGNQKTGGQNEIAGAGVYGARQPVAETYLVFVAMDESGQKRAFPPLSPRTEEERQAFREGEGRAKLRRG